MTRLATRAPRRLAQVSIVPMIDVLLILLIFFMVTSTYLDLDMVPAASRQSGEAEAAGEGPRTLLLRLGADGQVRLRGQTVDLAALRPIIAAEAAEHAELRVTVLPSPRASLQSMISLMDVAQAAGASSVGFLRLEGEPR